MQAIFISFNLFMQLRWETKDIICLIWQATSWVEGLQLFVSMSSIKCSFYFIIYLGDCTTLVPLLGCPRFCQRRLPHSALTFSNGYARRPKYFISKHNSRIQSALASAQKPTNQSDRRDWPRAVATSNTKRSLTFKPIYFNLNFRSYNKWKMHNEIHKTSRWRILKKYF